jgi:lipopolysaccharide heptosyltransferase II
VESYAVRLAGALQAHGYRSLVASAGGPLEAELAARGIPHFRLPDSWPASPRAGRFLGRLIRQEGVDLINAHNWSAGAIAYLAAKRAGIAYLLTVHGVRHPLQRFLVYYWGDRVVVASEESRRNLVEDLRVPAERVVCAPIGVDTERFRPATEAGRGGVAEELGLMGSPCLLHISRFSHSKGPVALRLIEAVQRLAADYPDVQALIVGQGPLEPVIRAGAAQMNRILNRPAVVFSPARPDVPELCKASDVVIATATVAMEAMACGKPVIAAGKAGFLGPVDESTLARGEETCFADHISSGSRRPLPPVTAERLVEAVRHFLANGKASRAAVALGQRVIEESHSLEALAQRVTRVYESVLGPGRPVDRIVCFHLNQVGDLIFSLPALAALRQGFPRAHITSVARPWLAPLLEASAFVDEVIVRPPGYRPDTLLRLARRLRRRRFDLAMGFSQSPATSLLARWSARRQHGFADAWMPWLYGRRTYAPGPMTTGKMLRLTTALGLPGQPLTYVGLLTVAERDRESAQALLCGDDRPLVALAPGASGRRQYKGWSAARFGQVAAGLAARFGGRPVVVGGASDRAQGEEIAAAAPDVDVLNLAGRTTVGELAGVLGQCALFVGIDSGPMHVAAALGVPVIGLFGPTDPHRTGPQGDRARVLSHREECGSCRPGRQCRRSGDESGLYPCMARITAEEVLAVAARLWPAGEGT